MFYISHSKFAPWLKPTVGYGRSFLIKNFEIQGVGTKSVEIHKSRCNYMVVALNAILFRFCVGSVSNFYTATSRRVSASAEAEATCAPACSSSLMTCLDIAASRT